MENTVYRQIKGICADADKLKRTLRELERSSFMPEGLAEQVLNAALLGEQIARKLRKLVLSSGSSSKREYSRLAANELGISVSSIGGVLEITLPMLLPKRQRGSDFLFDPLYFALERFAAENEIPQLRECVICFTHVYNGGTSARRVRDYDNLELKCALDAIVPFVLSDDSGNFCNVFHSTELGDCDKTLISVMVKNAFPNWLAAHNRFT
jgi:hypothetical protein